MRKNRRKALAVLAGVASIAVVGASAATLGSLNTGTLGATTTTVAACQSSGLGITWGAPTYVPGATAKYTINSGTITGIAAACNGKNFTVDVAGGAASLGTASGALPATGTSYGFTLGTAADVSAVTQVTLTIYG